jgi:hypothetical protein
MKRAELFALNGAGQKANCMNHTGQHYDFVNLRKRKSELLAQRS